MPATATRNQGKSRFVKEVLNDNPQANATAVNEAWQSAGMSGSISAGLVNHLRSRLGLSGNLRGGRRKRTRVAGTREGRPPLQIRTGADGSAAAMARKQSSELMGLEVEIDRLLMKAVEIGQLPDGVQSRRCHEFQPFSPGLARDSARVGHLGKRIA